MYVAEIQGFVGVFVVGVVAVAAAVVILLNVNRIYLKYLT